MYLQNELSMVNNHYVISEHSHQDAETLPIITHVTTVQRVQCRSAGLSHKYFIYSLCVWFIYLGWGSMYVAV